MSRHQKQQLDTNLIAVLHRAGADRGWLAMLCRQSAPNADAPSVELVEEREFTADDTSIEEWIETHGAVSAEVCEAMARGARERLGADYGIATTGIAGPDGGTPEKPVGLVYIGLVGPNADETGDVLIERASFWGSRADIRSRTSVRALDLLRRALGR